MDSKNKSSDEEINEDVERRVDKVPERKIDHYRGCPCRRDQHGLQCPQHLLLSERAGRSPQTHTQEGGEGNPDQHERKIIPAILLEMRGRRSAKKLGNKEKSQG